MFAISLGMVPHVCGELLAASAAWRSMVDNVGTVATQAFQLWLSEDEKELGWSGPAGVTVSGFVKPFDTWASMPHLLPAEDWPEAHAPRTIAYFCSVLDTSMCRVVRPDAQWRRASGAGAGPDLPRPRCGDAVAGRRDRRRIPLVTALRRDDTGGRVAPSVSTAQYWRANTDPSDRYVQSLPGTDQYRLTPAKTGFDNLVVAGDWTDNGLNAGCVEGATRSGQMAAEAVRAQRGGTHRMGGT